MRWSKLLLLTISLIILAIFSSFIFRDRLFLHFANKQLQAYEVSADCAQLNFDSQLNLSFKRLCLTHALGSAELEDLKIHWRWSLSWFWRFDTKVDSVQLQNLQVTGTSEVPKQQKQTQTELNPAAVHQLLALIDAIEIPTNISVRQFAYQPYGQKTRYPGQFSTQQNMLKIALQTPQKSPLLTLQLDSGQNRLSGTISADLFATQQLAKAHQIGEDDRLDLRGRLTASFVWRNQELISKACIKQLDISSDRGSVADGLLLIKGDLQLYSVLTLTQWQLELQPNSLLQLDIDETALHNLMPDSSKLKRLLSDNPSQGIELNPQGSLVLDFADHSLKSSAISLKNRNPDLPLKIELRQIESDFDLSKIKANHKIEGLVKIAQLEQISPAPMLISTSGTIEKSAQTITTTWHKSSQLRLAKLRIQQTAGAERLNLQWQGHISLEQNQLSSAELQWQSELQKVRAKSWIKADTVKSQGQLQADHLTMKLEGDITANRLPLARFNINGLISEPSFDISANAISIPDLAAIVQYRPVPFQPLDGLLDYRLTGQLQHFDDLKQNSAELQLNISNLSATVKDTWIQDLYYNQIFTLKNGLISAAPTQENLQLALIEAGSGITDVKMTLGIEQVQPQFRVNLENISGKVFGGLFRMQDFDWPTTADKAYLLELQELDLEKIVALEKQQGIVVTGKLSGELPLSFANDKITINDGRLYNVGDGLIQIKDNPAVLRLKTSQSDLKLAFDALQNLQYSSLTSEVTMTDDGQMLLETAIKGYNPDIDNEVNFNLNLDYDLLGLLKSLNIADTLEKSISDNSTKEKQ